MHRAGDVASFWPAQHTTHQTKCKEVLTNQTKTVSLWSQQLTWWTGDQVTGAVHLDKRTHHLQTSMTTLHGGQQWERLLTGCFHEPKKKRHTTNWRTKSRRALSRTSWRTRKRGGGGRRKKRHTGEDKRRHLRGWEILTYGKRESTREYKRLRSVSKRVGKRPRLTEREVTHLLLWPSLSLQRMKTNLNTPGGGG